MLAGDERDAGREHARGGPPGAEHVRVHELGAGKPRRQPVGEGARRRPLQSAQPRPEALGFEAVLAREPDAGPAGIANDESSLEPVRAQRDAQPQRAELRSARFQLREHADHAQRHDATSSEAGRRARDQTVTAMALERGAG